MLVDVKGRPSRMWHKSVFVRMKRKSIRFH